MILLEMIDKLQKKLMGIPTSNIAAAMCPKLSNLALY